MSLIKNNVQYAAFNYGHTINQANRYLNFKEGAGPELRADLAIGSFTLGQMAGVIATALNKAGNQEYTVTLDRDNRYFTIAAASAFDLLVDSGANTPSSAWYLLGFTNGDILGVTSASSNEGSGSQYITQMPLTGIPNFTKIKEKLDAVVRQTSSNKVESISYGTAQKMKVNFPMITNVVPQKFIRETATGEEELEAFMDYAIEKRPLEYLEDYRIGGEFVPCLLERTGSSGNGTGYEVKHLKTQGYPFHYKLDGLTFLKIEV